MPKGESEATAASTSEKAPCASVTPKLELRHVSQRYTGARGETLALDGMDLRVAPGESVAILGPSGCGKSTSLLAACGLQRPTGGSVFVDGEPVESPRLETALILQDFGLMPWKTVEQNAALGLQVRRLPKKERMKRAHDALRRVGLGDFFRSYPAELSGGMRQRLAMARALACDIDLLLMDEPLSALDALLREEMQNMLKPLLDRSGLRAGPGDAFDRGGGLSRTARCRHVGSSGQNCLRACKRGDGRSFMARRPSVF